MSDHGLKVAIELMASADACRVISELSCWYDDKVPYARDVARDLDMPVELLRRILHRMMDGGYAAYGTLYREDDGMPIGSSYWLTERGEQLRAQMPGFSNAVSEL